MTFISHYSILYFHNILKLEASIILLNTKINNVNTRQTKDKSY